MCDEFDRTYSKAFDERMLSDDERRVEEKLNLLASISPEDYIGQLYRDVTEEQEVIDEILSELADIESRLNNRKGKNDNILYHLENLGNHLSSKEEGIEESLASSLFRVNVDVSR